MPFEITHRYTKAVLYRSESATTIKQAVEEAVANRANMRGADMEGANMGGADMRGADMRGANMGGANMADANMRGADMEGANMEGANMRQTAAGEPLDIISRLFARVTCIESGYEWFAFELSDGPYKIKAGCRWLDPVAFETAALSDYGDDTPLMNANRACLAYIASEAVRLGVK